VLYAVGGYYGSRLSSVVRYNPGQEAWTAVAAMGSKRSGVGVAVVGGMLYAIGGYDGSSFLSSVERYDPGQDAWTAVAAMGSKRFGVGVAVVGPAEAASLAQQV
jgi:N-acetylneuraminic acid mutarotase